MPATSSNPLTLADSLAEAGIERPQAEAIAKAISYGDENAATKAHVESSTVSLRSEIAALRWMFGAMTIFVLGIAGFLATLLTFFDNKI